MFEGADRGLHLESHLARISVLLHGHRDNPVDDRLLITALAESGVAADHDKAAGILLHKMRHVLQLLSREELQFNIAVDNHIVIEQLGHGAGEPPGGVIDRIDFFYTVGIVAGYAPRAGFFGTLWAVLLIRLPF